MASIDIGNKVGSAPLNAVGLGVRVVTVGVSERVGVGLVVNVGVEVFVCVDVGLVVGVCAKACLRVGAGFVRTVPRVGVGETAGRALGGVVSAGMSPAAQPVRMMIRNRAGTVSVAMCIRDMRKASMKVP